MSDLDDSVFYAGQNICQRLDQLIRAVNGLTGAIIVMDYKQRREPRLGTYQDVDVAADAVRAWSQAILNGEHPPND